MSTLDPALPATSAMDADPTPVGDAWPPPPTLAGVAERFGRQFLSDAFAPLVLFLALNTVAGLTWAMLATTVWSGGTALLRRRAGKAAGPLVWLSLGFVILRGAAGIASGSDLVYFGPGIANNFVIAAVFVGSVALRRPIVGAIAPLFYAFPDELRHHRAYREVFSRLTLAWAALQVGTGVLQIALLATTTTNTYLVVRSLVSWPLTAALFVYSLRYPTAAFAREPDLAERVAAARSTPEPAGTR